MSEQKKTGSGWKTVAIISWVLLAILGIFSFFYIWDYKAEKIAYVDNSVQLYAGPDESYAPEETISGYFAYESEENGWLLLQRKNSDGEFVIRWVNTDDIDSWGEYKYKDSVEVATTATE